MPRVTIRLFGFGGKASGLEHKTENVSQGTNLRQLWESIRSSAQQNELLARIDERHVFFLRNGELVRPDQMQETPLEEGDTVTFMVLAVGG
jgi:molybdopterin converting factor small subunit